MRSRAARWVAELHGHEPDVALKARVERWLAKDPRHAAAFSAAMDAWRFTGQIPPELPLRASSPERGAWVMFGSCAAAASIAGLSIAIYLARDGGFTTGPEERRRVALSDGSEVSLNANSRVLVKFDDHLRKVTLLSGEALFEVAGNPSRPFVVVVGDQKIVALGTSFLVRREAPDTQAFAVTLVDGRVAVEPVAWPDSLPGDRAVGARVLSPGERLRFIAGNPPRLDTPSLERLTAWQQGQLVFDDATLAEAAAEFNRYGSRKLVIDSATAGHFRVGGVFKLDDPASFAQAMASAHHLAVGERHGDIILSDRRSDAP